MGYDSMGNYIPDMSAQDQIALANNNARLEQQRIAAMSAQGLNPDGSPKRPEFATMVDPATGQLSTQYQLKNQLLDPNSLEGFQAIKKLAMSEGPSKAAQLQNQQVLLNRTGQINAAAEQGAGAQAQARNAMAMRGGYSSGGAANLGRQSMKDILMAKQGAYGQANQGLLDVAKNDESMKNQMLQTYAGAEGNIANKNLDLSNSANQYNIGNLLKEKDLERNYNLETYKTAADKWAAEKQSEATRASGGGGGGGCCFIFLEARYGNGTMDKVVRRFRDENMTERNKRGYYKLSEVLVPLMRKYSLVKFAVRLFMTDPLVAYGKAHYGESKIGFIFKPVKNFWLKMFDYLGQDHKFIRENGETV